MTTLTTINGILQAQLACQLDMFAPPVFVTSCCKRSGFDASCLPTSTSRSLLGLGALRFRSGLFDYKGGIMLVPPTHATKGNPEGIDLGALKTDLEFLIERVERHRNEQALKLLYMITGSAAIG